MATIPGISDASINVIREVMEKELTRVNSDIAAALVEHSSVREGRWFQDISRRREKLVTAIDEIRQVQSAYRNIRQAQREAHSA